MKKYVHSKLNHKGRITIGLIPENSANEFENRMRVGIIEAAQKHNVNLICFTQLETISKDSVSYGNDAERYHHIHLILRQLVDEFELDGLLFLGWSILLEGSHLDDFKQHFAHIPILSLGKEYPDIPSVYCNGGIQLREMILHLIQQHGHQKIAFIESWNEDNRIDYYVQTMKENHIFNENLVISASDLRGVSIPERPQRALAILEERNASYDAIIVMRAEESRVMLEQLKKRGLQVPDDVALTSYEEDISIEFSDPPITTIYFPFKEIGYVGCEKMIELLKYGEIPHTTLVPCHIIIRNSCGCTNEASQMSETKQPHVDIDQDQDLAKAFLRSMENNSMDFLVMLQGRLKKSRVNYDEYQALISLLRNRYSPYSQSSLSEIEKSENVWHIARLAISDSERAWTAKDMFLKRSMDEILEQLSQSLLNTFNITKILNILEIYLRELHIHTCNVFLSEDTETASSFENCTHVYGLINNQRIHPSGERVNTKDYHKKFVQRESSSCILIVSLLYVEDNSMGYMSFEVGPMEGLLYLRVAILFSNALAGTFMIDKLTNEIALRKEKEVQLSYYARFDTETRLLNRRTFYESVSQMNVDKSFCVFLFDLDGFKAVNDSMGHDVGDRVLIEVSNRIKHVLQNAVIQVPRDSSMEDNLLANGIFRIGGDEFTAILDYIDPVETVTLANLLIEHIREPYYMNNIRIMITCSLGVSCYPLHTSDRNLMTKYADIAMYYAKKEGGNNYKFFNTIMEKEANMKLEIGNHLYRALENDELILHYQPQLDINEGIIIGVEALLRWNHPTKGAIAPSVFIPIAEELGLIIPIGDWVLRRACVQMKLWQDEGLPLIRIAVNLSTLHFSDIKLVEKVRTILEDTGLDARCLELEITENVAMKDEQLVVLHELRDLGVTIAVDDFGTHYSSLSYLKRFPVTKLKLDQSFVRGIPTDIRDREMIKAIIFVAKSFDLEIIAEGVENVDELKFLFDNGCSQIQGFHFYKPMDAEKITQIFNGSLDYKFNDQTL